MGPGGRRPVGTDARVSLTRGPVGPGGSPAAPVSPGSGAASAQHCGPGWQGPRRAAAAERRPQPGAAVRAAAGAAGRPGRRAWRALGRRRRPPGLPAGPRGVGGAAGPGRGPGWCRGGPEWVGGAHPTKGGLPLFTPAREFSSVFSSASSTAGPGPGDPSQTRAGDSPLRARRWRGEGG